MASLVDGDPESDWLFIPLPSNKPSAKQNRLVPVSRHEYDFSQGCLIFATDFGIHLMPVLVERLFTAGWKHPDKQRPAVRRVFKVQYSEENIFPYLQYKSQVTCSLGNKKHSAENFLWHGTTRNCHLGEQDSQFCRSNSCSLCSILRDSFSIDKSGSKNRFKRFGTGIYSSACSSKADDYSSNSSDGFVTIGTGTKAMILCRVVTGKPHKRTKNAQHLVAPPDGYHSTHGVPGEDLNYEETVVYENNAIRPAFLVIYGPPRPTPPLRMMSFKFVQDLFKAPIITVEAG